jgi:hypothetical protein
MALMKTKRLGTEPPGKQYTWEDVAKNEELKSRNKAAKEKYESDLQNYNKQVKFYKENEPKGKRDMTTFFQGGGRYLSEKELADWNKEQSQSGQEERAGLKASKIYVSKGYGSEQSGSHMKGESGKSYAGFKGTYHEWLENPKKPTLPAYEKEENIDTKKIPLQKLPLKPVQKIDQKKGKLSIPKKVEKEIPTWEEPSGGVRTKTRIVKAKNQSLGDYIGGNIKYAVSKVTGGEPGLRGGVKKTRTALIQGKSGREAKEFKAYYGAPSSISGSDRSGMTASDIAQERESLKGVKKQLRADIKKATPGSLISKSDLKSELRNVRKDIRATNKAEKYAEKNIEARSIYPNGKEEVVVRGKEDAKSKIYNPSLGEQYSAYSRSIKSSTDNPINKNKTFGRKVK